MDFQTSDDRRMLGDSLTRLLEKSCGFEARASFAYEAPFHSEALWSGLSELGAFFAFLPEDAGGIGGGGFDVVAVFEPLGRALSPEPVLGQLVGLRVLAASGADTDAALSGEAKLALAFGEPEAPWDISDITTTATDTPDGWQITGRKSVVYGGHVATDLLVAAQTGNGVGLFSVKPGDVTVQAFGMIDGGGAAEIALDAAPARLLLGDAESALNDALDWGCLALAGEALGAMEAAFALLTEYLHTRQQFGRPIGTFQALQHRTVDLRIEMEQARSITIRAADAMGTELQSRAVAQMKNLVGRAARLIAEDTIQMQGGIAMTWEYPASHLAKRLVMIDHQFGDADYHLSRLSNWPS